MTHSSTGIGTTVDFSIKLVDTSYLSQTAEGDRKE